MNTNVRLAPCLLIASLVAGCCHPVNTTPNPAYAPTLHDLQLAIDAHRKNLANTRTIRYKRLVPTFAVPAPTLFRDVTQGVPTTTDRPLDLAIQGDGFFQFVSPIDGSLLYSRNGNLSVDDTGTVVLATNPRIRLDPAIKIPANTTEIKVDPDGRVMCIVAGVTTEQQCGQIQLAHFTAPDLFKSSDGVFFTPSDPSTIVNPGDLGAGTLLSHALETSNVDPEEEVAAIRDLTRLKETISRAP
jgi:flagellar basal body rod protein FlgG